MVDLSKLFIAFSFSCKDRVSPLILFASISLNAAGCLVDKAVASVTTAPALCTLPLLASTAVAATFCCFSAKLASSAAALAEAIAIPLSQVFIGPLILLASNTSAPDNPRLLLIRTSKMP